MSELNPFEIAHNNWTKPPSCWALDEATHQLLRWPRRELKVTIPVRMDDGSVEIFHGYRVQYNDRPRADERWPALAPRRNHRHRARPGRLDDLEDFGGRHSAWAAARRA